MLRKTFEQVALGLLSLYFLTDGVQKVFDTEKETWVLKHKTQQLETMLYNNGFLLLSFTKLIHQIAFALTFCLGLVEIAVTCSFLYLADNAQQRFAFAPFLLCFLVYDALLMHFPFTEDAGSYQQELTHFTLDLILSGAVMMATGFRDFTTPNCHDD